MGEPFFVALFGLFCNAKSYLFVDLATLCFELAEVGLPLFDFLSQLIVFSDAHFPLDLGITMAIFVIA